MISMSIKRSEHMQKRHAYVRMYTVDCAQVSSKIGNCGLAAGEFYLLKVVDCMSVK